MFAFSVLIVSTVIWSGLCEIANEKQSNVIPAAVHHPLDRITTAEDLIELRYNIENIHYNEHVDEYNANVVDDYNAYYSDNIDDNCKQIDPGIMEDALLTTPGLLHKYGYKAEVHEVIADDGYVLRVHRITESPLSPPVAGSKSNKTVVFLQHGLLSSSADWILMGPQIGLGYKLADLGFDVWMGNARGSRYSRLHVSYDTQKSKYWQFSLHEIGNYDLPAMIDYALNATGHQKLHYIGYSQGTTAFWIMASTRPEYNEKIISMQALAPVAYLSHIRSPIVKPLIFALNSIEIITSTLGIREFLPNKILLNENLIRLCHDEAITKSMCRNFLFLLTGYDSHQLNTTMMPVIFGHVPAGASTRQMVHFGQLAKSGKFRMFDHGLIGNLFAYRKISPPIYQLANVTAPVYLYYAENDWLATPEDVLDLVDQLPNVKQKKLIDLKEFNHLDFIWANDAQTLVYNDVIRVLRFSDGTV